MRLGKWVRDDSLDGGGTTAGHRLLGGRVRGAHQQIRNPDDVGRTDDPYRLRVNATTKLTELQSLLDAADQASNLDRIRYRDPIAAFGADAIEVLEEWIRSDRRTVFAIQTIVRIGELGEKSVAAECLSRVRPFVSERDAELVMAGLAKLGVSAATPAVKDPHATYAIPPIGGRDWAGFKENEFGRIAGTSWRRRDDVVSLAPLITSALRYHHPSFESQAVERTPALHFAVTQRYRQFGERESGFRAAKLFVYAMGPNLDHPERSAEIAAGLYIEKGDNDAEPNKQGLRFGTVDESWDWPWLVRALRDGHVRDELSAAMTRHGLLIGDYLLDEFGEEFAVGFVGRIENGVLTLREADEGPVLATGWDAVVERLAELPPDKWHNLHLWRTWRKDAAIAAGPSFAGGELIPVLTDLTRVYLDIVQEAIEAVSRGYQIVARLHTPRGPAIRYRIQSINQVGHFNLPSAIATELGIPHDGSAHLIVDWAHGRWQGTLQTKSRNEMYCRVSDPATQGLQAIAPREPLTVTVWKA
jgi:hypothetical protein